MSFTPTFAETVNGMIETRLAGLHTMMPGKVLLVNVKTGKCDVQPLLMRLGSDGLPKLLPIITNCPIGFYRAGKAAVYLPLSLGDNVEIRFCERSLDTWLTKGGTVDPEDARKHNLSDAVVYPGLYEFTNPPLDADPFNLVVVNNQSKITMTPTGQISIAGIGGEELLKILSDLIQKLTTVTTPTMIGPQTFLPTDIIALQAIKARLETIRRP